eukprot:6348672-Pyramimonas_sp.AAC.1
MTIHDQLRPLRYWLNAVDRPRGRKTPGPAGQPAESVFDPSADADASSGDEATALDYSDVPTYLSEEHRAQ